MGYGADATCGGGCGSGGFMLFLILILLVFSCTGFCGGICDVK